MTILLGVIFCNEAAAFGRRAQSEVAETSGPGVARHRSKDGVYRGMGAVSHHGTSIPMPALSRVQSSPPSPTPAPTPTPAASAPTTGKGNPIGNFFRNVFTGGGSSSAPSGLVTPRKSSFSGNPNTIYFDVDTTDYCKAGTIYWYDKSQGWMECRALNRATGYSVGAGRDLGANASGRKSDGSPCTYRKGNGRSRGQGEVLPSGWSSGVYSTKNPNSNWGPEQAVKLDSLLRIHGRTGLGESPTLSQLEDKGGASGCVVTSDSCMRSISNNIGGVSQFRVQ